MSSLSRQLADYACALRYEQLPAEVLEKARACVLYQLGIGMAGHRLQTPWQVMRLMRAEGAVEESTLLLGGGKTSAMNAAFANAALFHARVQDDTHHTSHLGTVLISAGLTLAEAHGRTGRELVEALVAGYEVAAALGREYTARTTPRGFRASGIFGVLGAAVVASRLLQLNSVQTASAIGIAATLAGGSIQPFASGSEEFLLHNAQAARNGILAARMAAAGLCAAGAALDGPAGFLKAFAGEVGDTQAVLDGLGTRHEILNVNFKALPVCAGNQAPLANAQALGREIGDAWLIAAIRIEMHPYEAGHPGIACYGPFRSRVETLMSTPFCVALGLLGWPVDMAALQRFDDPQVLALVQRSQVVACEELPMLHSRITVELTDGRLHTRRMHLAPEDLRWSFARVAESLAGMQAELPFDPQTLAELAARVAQLESETEWRDLLELICQRGDG
ncbi:MmgE/PrpD family protein 4 [Pseudomonas cavernae]|uniref:MmgE/PrpD family protein 4 n=1 Tax=Pseudomonas cavernae TaxID=2320867 RepID=A0A385Z676_9PSED|nr:MmgE/PrpD family protein [Pseudomonas cavernae]AYC33002.1 MmgE/PrpD family protein 4 [Pseudomonas cavernae]